MYARFVVLFGVFATAILLIFGVLLVPSILFLYYKKSDLSRALEVEKESQQIVNVQSTISDVAALNKSADALKSFENSRISFGDLFDSIAEVSPQGVVFTLFEFDAQRNSVAVKGTSQRREQFLALKEGLEKNPLIASVASPISNIIKESNIQFAITITLKKK